MKYMEIELSCVNFMKLFALRSNARYVLVIVKKDPASAMVDHFYTTVNCQAQPKAKPQLG